MACRLRVVPRASRSPRRCASSEPPAERASPSSTHTVSLPSAQRTTVAHRVQSCAPRPALISHPCRNKHRCRSRRPSVPPRVRIFAELARRGHAAWSTVGGLWHGGRGQRRRTARSARRRTGGGISDQDLTTTRAGHTHVSSSWGPADREAASQRGSDAARRLTWRQGRSKAGSGGTRQQREIA